MELRKLVWPFQSIVFEEQWTLLHLYAQALGVLNSTTDLIIVPSTNYDFIYLFFYLWPFAY